MIYYSIYNYTVNAYKNQASLLKNMKSNADSDSIPVYDNAPFVF